MFCAYTGVIHKSELDFLWELEINMDIIISVLNLAGSLVCHQLPSRTIYAQGVPLPVCARDTGVYLGVFTGVLFILLFRRLQSDRQPSLPYAVVLCLLMLPMMVDGIGSYLGFYTTNNTARLFTGVLFGLPLPVFLIPAANFKIHGINKSRILRSPLELAALVVAGIIACIPVLQGRLPWVLPAAAIILSMIFIIGRIVFTIFSLARPGRRKKIYLKTAGATACVLFVMYIISNFILQPLKVILLK